MKKRACKKLMESLLLSVYLTVVSATASMADGFIVVPPPQPGPMPGWKSFPMEVKYHNVDVEINGMSAITSIDQEFYNPTGRRLDGYYIFPIPEGASIGKFSMFIDGKETEAEMLDSKKAKAIYEDIVRRNIDPALLEYYGQGLFRVRIFPIEPYSTKRIKISYREILHQDNGTAEYLYPLNTEKYSAKELEDVLISVTIQSTSAIKNIYSPTHKNFILFFRSEKSKIGMSMLAQTEPDESKGFFMLDISPDLEIKKEDIEVKDITFVLDVSGSMAGDKLKQAKKALIYCIDNLNEGDRFEVIRFSTEAEPLFGNLAGSTEKNLEKAKRFINDLKAMGGTNIEDALQLALNNNYSSERSGIIMFITDGKPTVNETDEDKLTDILRKRGRNKVKIFTFGIGDDINTHLLDKITTLTNSYRTYISPKEDIEVKISGLYEKIQSPVLTDLKIKADQNVKLLHMYPKELPDLFRGASITVMGRYEGKGKSTIALEGRWHGRIIKYETEYDFTNEERKNDFIPPLWAARKAGYLLDQIRMNGESKEVIDELVNLSKKYGIITPYTSYLIVEDEERKIADKRIIPEEQTIGYSAPPASISYQMLRKSYSDMREKSGSGSVAASKEVQSMNDAVNIAATRKGGYETGVQIRSVHGRAFYKNGIYWIDPEIQRKKYDGTIRMKYGTLEYFSLIRDKVHIVEFLSLGKNVRFVYERTLYEISE
jgi:Ca-activated chloride channel family protein